MRMALRTTLTLRRSLAATAVALALAVTRPSEGQLQAAGPTPCPPSTVGRIPSPRDPRPSFLRHRVATLVDAEVQGLEGLIAATPATAPERAPLLRRLAEDYVELENARAMTAASSRQKAIDDYTRIATEYPNYAQLDEVHYYLGLEREREGDVSNARRAYFTLIQQRPASPFVPLAYLAFADLFFDEAKGDPTKWELAAQAYEKVVSYPPPQNRAYGYAWYRLAHVRWHQGDTTGADQSFAKASAYAASYPTLAGSSEIASVAGADRAALHGATAPCP